MPEPKLPQNGQFEFLHLKGVEIAFKDKRPKYPVKVKLIGGSGKDEPKTKEFASAGDPLVWDTDIHLSPNSKVQVAVKESQTIKWRSKKDFASVWFKEADISEGSLVTKEDEAGLISVKLTFASSVPAGEVARKEAKNAEERLEKKPIALQKLGKARKFIEVAKNFGQMLSDLHPAAKAALIAFDMLYQRLEEQEQIHEDAADLLEDLQLFLPFTEVVDPTSIMSEAARSAIKDFLNLFKETCEFVVKFSSTGILGDLISSQKGKVNQLEGDFRKVKSRYDWSIKTDVWRATLKLEKYGDDEMLRLLQVSFSGPAGKEYYRTDRCCLPGTRAGVLDMVAQWAEVASDQKLFWMHGIAGSGKSAIANTVARIFDEQRLLAGCFFCKRDDPDLRNTEKVIPSLAFHLSVWHQPYSAKLLSILQSEEKNKLASKTVQEQFELLIKGPALEVFSDQENQPPRPLIIVIDALDECGDSLSQRSHLARTLVQIAQLVPWLKLFVTSRPLPEFSQVFEGTGDALKKIHLNEAGDPTADIMLYTKYRANLVADEFCIEPTWLSENQVTALTRKAHGLFIWTSTVFNFIQGQLDVEHALEIVFAAAPDREDENPEAALDDIYRMVLQEVGKGGPHNLLLVKTIAGVIFCTAKNVPLPVDAIHKLVPQFSDKVVGRVVDQLQAVLYKDIELQNAIRVCHPSFLDFMSRETRSVQFWTRPSDLDLGIATRCLEIMKEGLCFNICHLETSYLANKDVPDLDRRVATEISRALSYSCLYWMSHVQGADASKREELMNLIAAILCDELALYWIEVLSLLQELKKGIQILSQAVVTLSGSELKAMALELFRFVSAFHDAISTSTPHLYISAFAWLPSECLIVQKLGARFNDQMPIKKGKSAHWPNTLLTIPEIGLVRVVAYSPDGLHIASGLQEGIVCIRDSQTGNLKGPPLRGHSGQITSVVFSPNGKILASSSHDQTILIWDVETGVPTREAIIPDAKITSLAFFPDGRRLVSGSADSTIQIWDVETGELVKGPFKGLPGSIRAIAVSPPDGRYIASALDDSRTIQIWDAESGEAVGKPLEGHTNWVVSLVYSPDGKYIVSGSYDKTVRIWDATTGELFKEPFRGHTDYIVSVAISPKGNLVVSASHDKTIRTWDVTTGKLVGRPLRGHTNWAVSVAFSPDGRHIASGSHDKSIRVWDLETGNYGEEQLKGKVTSIASSPDGKRVASGSTDKIIQLWDSETGQLLGQPFKGHTSRVNSIAFSSDGKYLVSGSDDTTVRLWDVESQDPIDEPFEGNRGWVKSVAFSKDGKKIVSGSVDKTVRIWDVKTKKLVGLPLEDNNDYCNAVAFCPDGQHVAAGYDDSTIRIWNIESGTVVGEPLAGHGDQLLSVTYSPDGKYIAAGFIDSTIRIWNVESDFHIALFDYAGTSGAIQSVAYSPDGTRLASGSEGGEIEIWDALSGEADTETLVGHTARVVTVAYSLDGRYIVSGSEDGTIRLWEAERTSNAQATELDGVPPFSVPGDGWIRTSGGELLLWVPVEHRNGICDTCSLCIPPDALGHPVRVGWDKLCHGTTWTTIRKQ